jgi:putative transposase
MFCFPVYLIFYNKLIKSNYGAKIQKTKTTVLLINYHFVFLPSPKGMGRSSGKAVQAVGEKNLSRKRLRNSCEGSDAGSSPFVFEWSSTDLPSDFMAKLKGVTFRKLNQEFNNLSHLPSLWTREGKTCKG